jgi:uncharacterized membrane protein
MRNFTARGAWQAAAVAAMAFALSACDGAAPAGDGAAGSEASQSGSTRAPASSATLSRQTDSGVQPQAATGPLDYSAWLVQPPFYAAGEEPDWRLDIEDGWFAFKRSGLPVIDAPLVQPVREGGADVFNTPPLKVTIKRQPCQTSNGGGQADIIAEVTLDDTVFEGCAFSGGSAGPSPEAETIADALGPIDACLKELKQPALITAVVSREGDRTSVALRAKEGTLHECMVESDGKIAFLDPIEPSAAGPWMSRMRFLRQGVADTIKCDGAEEVRAGDTLAGRFLLPKCRF